MHYSSQAVIGVSLAVFGYVFIAIADSLSKDVQQHISFTQLILFRQMFQFVLMAILWRMFFASKQKFVIPPVRSLQFVRILIMLAVIAMYMSSLDYLEIGVAISLLNTAPLFAVPFAIWLLNERINKSTIMALCFGFIGVLMIVQPGFEEFHPAMILVLVSAALIGLYMVVSRMLALDMHPINFLCYQSILVAVPFMLLSYLFWQPVPSDIWLELLIVGILGNCFHLFFLIAVRNLEANSLAPLMYIEVISGLLFGYWYFGTIPNDIALIGIGVITIAGLLLTVNKTKFFRRRSAPR